MIRKLPILTRLLTGVKNPDHVLIRVWKVN